MTEIDVAIEDLAEESIELLTRLVAESSTVGQEQGAIDVLAAAMEELGFESERIPFSAGHIPGPIAGVAPVLGDGASQERYQLLAVSPGTGPIKLLLNGHIDVVPAAETDLWTNEPFEPTRRDGRMYGRGAGDMKCGFAIGHLALAALLRTHPDLFRTQRIGLLAVIEEECTGNGALVAGRAGAIGNEVLILEPTDLGVMIGGVGVLWIEMRVFGRSSHAQAADRSGNAIELGMQVIAALQTWSADLAISHPDPELRATGELYTVNVGEVHAGDWVSSAPGSATFGVRVGFPRGWTADQAESEVREVIRTASQGFPLEPAVALTGFRAPGYLVDPDGPLVRDLVEAHRDAHGSDPDLFSLGSTTDARTFLHEFDVPAACYGAVVHDMHGVDENVELDSIAAAARTVARFILTRFDGGVS